MRFLKLLSVLLVLCVGVAAQSSGPFFAGSGTVTLEHTFRYSGPHFTTSQKMFPEYYREVEKKTFYQDAGVFKIGDTTYFPRVTDAYVSIRQEAFAVVQPKTYNPLKQYPVVMVIHGIGERSEGKLENLRNLVMGFDYGSGVRQYPLMTNEFKAQVNSEEFLAVIVTYQGEYNPTSINWVLDEVEKRYSVDKSREMIIGFSLGGGAVTRYFTSSTVNANRVAFAVACAPVNWAGSYQNVRDAKLPVLFVTAQSDPTVSPNNTKTMVAGINNGATIPAYAIYLPYTGHTGLNEVLSGNNQYIPQSVFKFLKTVSNVTRKAYPASGGGSVVDPPVTPPATGPVIIRENVPAITSTGLIDLSACKTTGSTYIYWSVISVPKGASLYTNPFGSSGYCKTTAKFTVEGAYGLTVTATNGNLKAVDTFYVTYQKTSQPVPKVAQAFDSKTGMLTYTDGSTEPGTATIIFTGSGKKVEVVTAAGSKFVYQ